MTLKITLSDRCTGEYLQQAAVTLLPLLHVQVPAARPSQQTVRLRDVEQTHAATVQQADGQICSAAAAELLTRHEAEGQRSQAVNTAGTALQTQLQWWKVEVL